MKTKFYYLQFRNKITVTCVIPKAEPIIVVRRKIFLNGTFFRNVL